MDVLQQQLLTFTRLEIRLGLFGKSRSWWLFESIPSFQFSHILPSQYG